MIKKIKIVLNFPIDVWQMFVAYLPGPIGYKLRQSFWGRRLKFLGKDVKIDTGIYFQNPGFISIDDGSWIDRNVIILAGPDRSNRKRKFIENKQFPLERGMVYIGKGVHIAPFVMISGIGGVYISDDCGIAANTKIYSFSHHFRSNEEPWNRKFCFSPFVEPDRQFMYEGPIFLGKNVGVALNVVILPGVVIEDDSFVLMNSVVMSSFGENSLIKGEPAKRLMDRYE